MKIFFSEFQPDSDKYHYPYQIYALREEGDLLADMYEQGFLPTRIEKDLWYMTRSFRVNLDEYEPSSENRRVLKKNPEVALEVVRLEDFEFDHSISKFAVDYFMSRFGKKVISAPKVRWLFTEGVFTHVFLYKERDEVIGYCIANMDSDVLHYAYPFYKPELVSRSLGMAMMTLAINYAQDYDLLDIYLGTCVNEAALYKTQYRGASYFTGVTWEDDMKELKRLVREGRPSHSFIEHGDRKELLDNIRNYELDEEE